MLSIRDAIESKPQHGAPYWEKIAGNLITFSTISGVLLWAIYAFFKALCTGKVFLFSFNNAICIMNSLFQPLKSLITPDKNWVSALKNNFELNLKTIFLLAQKPKRLADQILVASFSNEKSKMDAKGHLNEVCSL